MPKTSGRPRKKTPATAAATAAAAERRSRISTGSSIVHQESAPSASESSERRSTRAQVRKDEQRGLSSLEPSALTVPTKRKRGRHVTKEQHKEQTNTTSMAAPLTSPTTAPNIATPCSSSELLQQSTSRKRIKTEVDQRRVQQFDEQHDHALLYTALEMSGVRDVAIWTPYK